MTSITGTRFATAVFVGLVAVQLTGCSSTKTVKPDGSGTVGRRRRLRPDELYPIDVHCPDGVKAEVGAEFDCHFTGPQGVPYTAHMRITKVDGDSVTFDVKSRPS